jgi:catechol 2,3-dioxygenase-like lactoylglutathione lyase family enzyme
MVHMVELTVRDAAASARWYVAALGFAVELTDAATGFVLLHHPGGGRLALLPGEPVAAGVKLHLRATDLDAEVERLRGIGVVPDGAVKSSGEGYRRARFADPDGVAVVLFEWCRPGA